MPHSRDESLKDELLQTLSFLEPMNLEKIYLDFDKDYLIHNHKLTTDSLNSCLDELLKLKKIKKITTENDGQCWIRIYPKRSFLAVLKSYFSLSR